MIRIVGEADLPEVVRLVTLGAEERGHKVSKDTLTDSVKRAYYMAPSFLVEDDGKAVGVACMTLGCMPWSQEPYLTSIMVYVLPEKRKYDIINGLYKAIKRYAKLHGLLYMDTFIGTDRIDGRARLARSQGLKQTGISIMYEAKDE